MSRVFLVTRSVFLVVSILLFLAIPVIGFFATVFSYNGTCSGVFSFDQPCAWWQYMALTMIYTAFFALPPFLVTLLIWAVMTLIQLFTTRKKK
jgi:hypothetical protein